MSKKPKKSFEDSSRWKKRYRKDVHLWIPARKRVYLYWFKFLQIAEQESDRKVDWRKYRGWGGGNEIVGSKFDDWWEDHWVDLFGVENAGDEPKFPLTTKKPEADAYRTALLVYQNKEMDSNWEIAIKIEKEESSKRKPVPSFFYAQEDLDTSGRYMWDEGWDYHTNPEGAENQKRKYTVQSRVGRYLSYAEYFLDNVCEGYFPIHPDPKRKPKTTPKLIPKKIEVPKTKSKPPTPKKTKKELAEEKERKKLWREILPQMGFTEIQIRNKIRQEFGS